MDKILQFHFNPYSLVFLLLALISVSLFVFLLRRRYASLTILLFLTVLGTSGLYDFMQFFAINTITSDAFHFWNLLLYFPLVFIPPLQLSFVLAYSGKESWLGRYWYPFVTFLPAILLLFLIWTTQSVISSDIRQALVVPWGYMPNTKALGNSILPLYHSIYYGIIILLLLFFFRQVTDFEKRIKAIFLITAMFIPAIGSVFFTDILPAINHLPLFPTDSIMASITVFITFYAILKYGISFFTPLTIASVVLKTMTETVIGVNPAYTVEFINHGGEILLHSSRQQIENKPLATLFPSPDHYKQILDQLLIPLKTKERTNLEKIEIQTGDGQKIPVAISASKLLDKDNRIAGYILLLNDMSKIIASYDTLTEKITEIQQKNTDLEHLREELLREKGAVENKILERTRDLHTEHARLQASINNLSLGFIMTDKDKSIILLNKAVKDIFYLAYPETGISLQDVQNHLTTINILEDLETALQEQKRVVRTDVHMESKFLNIFITPIVVDEKGDSETIGAVIIIEDETTVKLIQQSKEEFFAIASHELRTPLTAIRGYISLIKQYYFEEVQDEQFKQMLTDIDRSSNRLINLVNDFLDTSKLEQGKIKVRQEPCDIIIVVDEAIKETQSIAIEKKLSLKRESESQSVMVLGDKERLKQVVINLISNAMKFTTLGGITVHVNPSDGSFVKVIVQDTGRGITQENKALLFQKFQQAQEGSLIRVEGTGLGLYISKLLIEKMGGRIQLENSEINKGSAFSFTVPVLHVDTNS